MVDWTELRDPDAGRSRRRRSPIMAYVGPNGGGKSLAMVHDTLPSLRAGRTVLSTVRLLAADGVSDHPAYVRLTNLGQLLEAEHCDVLFDEVVGIAGSRDAMSLPPQIANLLVQLRRRDVVLRWTAPAYGRADRIIREVTQTVTVCRGFLPGRAEGALWRQKRLFWLRTFDAATWDDLTQGTIARASSMVNKWFWRPGVAASLAYDTLAPVESLAVIDAAGTCLTCGGYRSRRKCTCAD